MKRIQNKIAESRATLPVVSVYGALVAVAIGAVGMQLGSDVFRSVAWWEQTLLLALSTMLMVELNNANSLIRIYSRMVSCSFLVLTLMATFLYPSLRGGIVGLSFIVFYVFYLQAYQDQQAVGRIYAAFLALGVGSLCFVQLFYFVPLFWLLMGTRLISLSGRTFMASLLGLATPYWLVGGYFLYTQDYLTPLHHFQALGQFMPLSENPLLTLPSTLHTPHSTLHTPHSSLHTHPSSLLTSLFVLLLSLTGIIHYLRQSSGDRLRTQMIYEIFIFVLLFTILFLVLQPQHLPMLLRLLIIGTAPLIGHFIALTHTRITNVAFLLILVLILLLTACNLLASTPWIS